METLRHEFEAYEYRVQNQGLRRALEEALEEVEASKREGEDRVERVQRETEERVREQMERVT